MLIYSFAIELREKKGIFSNWRIIIYIKYINKCTYMLCTKHNPYRVLPPKMLYTFFEHMQILIKTIQKSTFCCVGICAFECSCIGACLFYIRVYGLGWQCTSICKCKYLHNCMSAAAQPSFMHVF